MNMTFNLTEPQVEVLSRFGCAGTVELPTNEQLEDFARSILDFGIHHIPQLENMGFDRFQVSPVSVPVPDSPPSALVSSDDTSTTTKESTGTEQDSNSKVETGEGTVNGINIPDSGEAQASRKRTGATKKKTTKKKVNK